MLVYNKTLNLSLQRYNKENEKKFFHVLFQKKRKIGLFKKLFILF